MSDRSDTQFGENESTVVDGAELAEVPTRDTAEPRTEVAVELPAAERTEVALELPAERAFGEEGATEVSLTLDELRPRMGDDGSRSPRTETAIRADAAGFDDPGRTEERPTVAPAAPSGSPATVEQGAPPAAAARPVSPSPVGSPARPSSARRSLALPLLLVGSLLAVAVALVIALDLGPGSEELAAPLDEVPARAAAAEAAPAEPPTGVAPPLPEAAQLVAAGRFADAARAYALLARDHPDRPELATMARILERKARR